MVTDESNHVVIKRHTGDTIADQAFSFLKDHPEVYRTLQKIIFNRDLAGFNATGPLKTLIAEVHLPVWTNKESLDRGGDFFRRHAQEIFGVLGLYSLPYCYAGANGVQVLYHSKRIRTEPAKRLLETAQFVLEVCEPGAFTSDGKGFVSILKVRLMHAAARHYAREVITHEEPVNQEDMLGTMLAFSLIVVRGLRKLGIQVEDRNTNDYFHLWHTIGHMLGIQDQWLPATIRQASQLERQIRNREFKFSPEAEELTSVLINHIDAENSSGIPVRANQLMAFFLGEEVGACLGLKSLSAVEKNLFETGSRLRFSFKSFTESNFQQVVKAFDANLAKENVQPAYKISYK